MNTGIRKIVFFLALIGMSYLGWAYMIKPANAALATQRIELQKNMAKLNELERVKADTENLEVQIQQMDEAIKFFEDKLPHKSEIHKVLAQVSEMVKKNNLNPKTNKTQSIKSGTGYIELPLKMQVTGGFNSYYAFLLQLEKMDRITNIRELEIEEKKEHSGDITADFIVSIFFKDANG
jgi:type IV pilus assembly protein PilO